MNREKSSDLWPGAPPSWCKSWLHLVRAAPRRLIGRPSAGGARPGLRGPRPARHPLQSPPCQRQAMRLSASGAKLHLERSWFPAGLSGIIRLGVCVGGGGGGGRGVSGRGDRPAPSGPHRLQRLIHLTDIVASLFIDKSSIGCHSLPPRRGFARLLLSHTPNSPNLSSSPSLFPP